MENINLRLRQNDPNAPQVDELEVNNAESLNWERPDKKTVAEVWTLVDDFEDQIKVLKDLTSKGLKKQKDEMWDELDREY